MEKNDIWGALSQHRAFVMASTHLAAGDEEYTPQSPSSSLPVTLLEGLDLFPAVADSDLQARLVAFVEAALEAGRAGELEGRTFQRPSAKWAATGQSRDMIQYGAYTNSNRIQPVPVAPLPPLLLHLVDLLVARGVFSESQRPDACTVNVYAPHNWLPPHIDSENFDRPFCTVSLLSEQQAVFGEAITGEAGIWAGGLRVSMPCGSALRVTGYAAGPDCMHAVPCPSSRRISLTFRRVSQQYRTATERERREREQARATARAARAADNAAKVVAQMARMQQVPGPEAVAEATRRFSVPR